MSKCGRGNGVTGNELETSRTPSQKKIDSCFWGEKGGRVLEQPVTGYPVTPHVGRMNFGFITAHREPSEVRQI